jgi:hypothetical protein
MNVRRAGGAAVIGAALLSATGCGIFKKKQAEVVNIEPSVTFNQNRAALGSPIEVTYTWKVGADVPKMGEDYRALVHFLDSHEVMLFEDDHIPVPPPSQWEAGKTYTYKRTKFIPIYPYVGDVDVRMGLYPQSGRGERLALKGEDAGLREYKVAKMVLQPQTENIFLVHKEGWHSPESSPQNPSIERTWTKKDALVQFKNPKKDVVIYLEADTNAKAFTTPPVLTVSVNNTSGLAIPVENSDPFLKKIRVKAADLGTSEWVDLRLGMSEAFVPKERGVNTHDDRELGVLVHHLFVAEADKVGGEVQVVDATPLPTAMASTTTSPAPPVPAGKAGSAPAGKPAGTKAPATPASGTKAPATQS